MAEYLPITQFWEPRYRERRLESGSSMGPTWAESRRESMPRYGPKQTHEHAVKDCATENVVIIHKIALFIMYFLWCSEVGCEIYAQSPNYGENAPE
jgi:hypothetical protein